MTWVAGHKNNTTAFLHSEQLKVKATCDAEALSQLSAESPFPCRRKMNLNSYITPYKDNLGYIRKVNVKARMRKYLEKIWERIFTTWTKHRKC